MMKMKLLTVVLIILSAIGVALAADVINVDIKGFGDKKPYVGNGAYDVGNDAVWTVFYGGWGVPVGSARSEGLVEEGQQPGYYSVFASQVWLGDNGKIHGYDWNSPPAMMNDGFTATAPNEPNISIWGQGAYQGVYDIYVYGNSSDAGSFTLDQNGVKTPKAVTGGIPAGTFVENGNYVIFPNVDINDADSSKLYLTYTNKLNGLQFVRKYRDPCEISVDHNTVILAADYAVAGEKNIGQYGETQLYGPDIFGGGVDGYVYPQEFMVYDINVSDANKGRYNIGLDVNVNNQVWAKDIKIYLDDANLGHVNYDIWTPPLGLTTTVSANLLPGKHTIAWEQMSTDFGFNIYDVNLVRTGPITMSNCDEVIFYGRTLPADFSHNCSVGLEDLAIAMENWLSCNNPDYGGCF